MKMLKSSAFMFLFIFLIFFKKISPLLALHCRLLLWKYINLHLYAVIIIFPMEKTTSLKLKRHHCKRGKKKRAEGANISTFHNRTHIFFLLWNCMRWSKSDEENEFGTRGAIKCDIFDVVSWKKNLSAMYDNFEGVKRRERRLKWLLWQLFDVALVTMFCICLTSLN